VVLAAAGALGIVLSLFIAWRKGGVHPGDISASFLWDRFATGDPSMFVWLVPIALVAVAGVFVPGAGALRALAGLAMLAVCGLFAWQLDRLGNRIGADLGDLLDSGFYFGVVGGFLALLSAAFPSGWFARRTDSTDSTDSTDYLDDDLDDARTRQRV
jgi:hypothetical protein